MSAVGTKSRRLDCVSGVAQAATTALMSLVRCMIRYDTYSRTSKVTFYSVHRSMHYPPLLWLRLERASATSHARVAALAFQATPDVFYGGVERGAQGTRQIISCASLLLSMGSASERRSNELRLPRSRRRSG